MLLDRDGHGRLLMLVPTRGRLDNVIRQLRCWRETTKDRADLCYVIDDDDPVHQTYVDIIRQWPYPHVSVAELSGPHKSMVIALNHAADVFKDRYSYLGFMGDDHLPRTIGWDRRVCEELDRGAMIVYGDDLLQRAAMPTAVTMPSTVVKALGYMAPPQFRHLCIDLVWKDWGDGVDRLVYLDDVVIEHAHPAAGKAIMDERYEAVNCPEVATADGAAYYDYRDNGGLAADLKKLRTLS